MATPPEAVPIVLLSCLLQLSRHNKQLQHLLKPVKRIQEEEAEGISSMVRVWGWSWAGVGEKNCGPRAGTGALWESNEQGADW